MFKVLVGLMGWLFRVAWLVLARATFLTWLVGLWAAVKCPALQLAIRNSHPAVTIGLALVSVLVVSRFLGWLVRITNGLYLSCEQPQPRLLLVHHHRVGW